MNKKLIQVEEEHPWLPAKNEFENIVLPELKKLGHQIGLDSKSNKYASDIIKYYNMLYSSFDPVTMILLQEALEKYKKDTSEKRFE